MRTTALPLAASLSALLFALPGHAARPLVSETADSLAASNCELETAVGSSRTRGEPTVRALDALVACGIGHGTQFSGAYNRSTAAGLAAQAVTLAGKTNLVEPKDGQTGYALAYGASLDREPGNNWRHGSTRLFGVATRALTEQLLGHLNLGWLRTENPRLNHTIWSIGVEGDTAVRWAADVYGDDRSRPWVSAGLLWPLADKVTVNLAYAQQFESPRVRQLTLGFKFDF